MNCAAANRQKSLLRFREREKKVDSRRIVIFLCLITFLFLMLSIDCSALSPPPPEKPIQPQFPPRPEGADAQGNNFVPHSPFGYFRYPDLPGTFIISDLCRGGFPLNRFGRCPDSPHRIQIEWLWTEDDQWAFRIWKLIKVKGVYIWIPIYVDRSQWISNNWERSVKTRYRLMPGHFDSNGNWLEEDSEKTK